MVNYYGNSTYASAPQGQYRQQTTDVGSFPPNAFGLYDMHGNVWEWCFDDYINNYNATPKDGSALTRRSKRKILRGGSWYRNPDNCRSADRNNSSIAYSGLGFRVLCVAGVIE